MAVISTAQYFAPRLLAEFCRRHANVQLRLDVCNRAAIIGHLERDDVDAAIMGHPPAELAIDCAAEPFARHPHVVIAPVGHPLARRKSIPVRALMEEPFISREPGSGTRLIIQTLIEKRGVPFTPTMVMNSNETIKQAVIAGMGLSFLSLHTVGLEVATGTLVPLDVVGTPVVRRWYLVHRTDKRFSPAAIAENNGSDRNVSGKGRAFPFYNSHTDLGLARVSGASIFDFSRRQSVQRIESLETFASLKILVSVVRFRPWPPCHPS